jgi:hypothetical protein
VPRQDIGDNRARVEPELGFVGISATPRALVVIGRTAILSDDNRRKIVTMQERQPRLQILTYDDIIANARAVFQRLLGPLDIVVAETIHN